MKEGLEAGSSRNCQVGKLKELYNDDLWELKEKFPGILVVILQNGTIYLHKMIDAL